jgi:hypothetical protein
LGSRWAVVEAEATAAEPHQRLQRPHPSHRHHHRPCDGQITTCVALQTAALTRSAGAEAALRAAPPQDRAQAVLARAWAAWALAVEASTRTPVVRSVLRGASIKVRLEAAGFRAVLTRWVVVLELVVAL